VSPPIDATELRSRSLELKQRAEALLPILRRQARRPYFVELAGTPKAGKSTALQVLHRFLKDCGYQVHEMRERAAECPIAMKGHFFFNTWTTTTMLAAMIESLESDADVVLLDRGVFDAIVWLEAQSLEHQVSPEERQVFRDFVLLGRWRTLTDLTFVLTVDPQTALVRENKDLLTPRTGSIMGSQFLERYNRVLRDVQDSVRHQFTFVDVDTTVHDSPPAATHEIATALVERMSGWVDPEIVAIPRQVAEEVFRDGAVRSLPDAIEAVERALVVRRRSDLERDDGFVQVVSAAVLRHEGQLLLLRRDAQGDGKIEAFGRDVLWKGCHVERPRPGTSLLEAARAAIEARLKEDFHIAQLESEPVPRVLVWNRDNPKDARHLGVLCDIEIAPAIASSLTGKVFKRERDRTKLRGSRFVTAAELADRLARGDDIDLEPWSRALVRHLVAQGAR
jgi:thymidylate kinase/predicted NUDIX family phosphoesterase